MNFWMYKNVTLFTLNVPYSLKHSLVLPDLSPTNLINWNLCDFPQNHKPRKTWLRSHFSPNTNFDPLLKGQPHQTNAYHSILRFNRKVRRSVVICSAPWARSWVKVTWAFNKQELKMSNLGHIYNSVNIH